MTAEQNRSIIQGHDLESDFIDWIDSENFDGSFEWLMENFLEGGDFDEEDEKLFALMEHTGDLLDDVKTLYDDEDYLVLTDEEADEKWEEGLNNLLDDCVLPGLEETHQYYFDREKWISDAKDDGRGHTLSPYDGNEDCVIINRTDYYIYRCN